MGVSSLYYPYFRGKQFELITIRECAQLIADAGFVPIIEPVREQTGGLKKTLEALCEAGADAIVIANPQTGDLAESGNDVATFISTEFNTYQNIHLGFVVTDSMSMNHVETAFDVLDGHPTVIIHYGFSEPRSLGQLAVQRGVSTNIFLDGSTGKLYQRHFRNAARRVLLRDGFEIRRNRDHPDAPEFFSDLHITFVDEGMNGFGDFLIVGDEYLESGGPAYTIAIHLTFIDDSRDEAMYVQHFKSIRQDTPKDPAGKFAEAVEKLVQAVDHLESKYIDSEAIGEFRKLYESGHYPGLGYVKKLSMKHHLETLAAFFKSEDYD